MKYQMNEYMKGMNLQEEWIYERLSHKRLNYFTLHSTNIVYTKVLTVKSIVLLDFFIPSFLFSVAADLFQNLFTKDVLKKLDDEAISKLARKYSIELGKS